MDIEPNFKIVGRDRDGFPNCSLVDNTSALTVSNNNIPKIFMNMYEAQTNTGSGSLVLTPGNQAGSNPLYFYTTGLIPNFGTARAFTVVSSATGPKVRLYGIDLQGYELIFYITVAGGSPVTTGNTKLDGTGTTVNMTTGLTHINWMEFVVPNSTSSIIVSLETLIGSLGFTVIRLYQTYTQACSYLCPKGRKTVCYGFSSVNCNVINNYCWTKFVKNSDNTYGPIFSTRITIPVQTTFGNTFQWSDSGFVSVNEGEWLFLNRDSGTSQTVCELKAVLGEYKI